jgi:hypothetical protein
VFTSDHGDFLGDHWLGEKEFLLEPAVGVPLIVRDPRPAADISRGTVDERLVETIDALPTFLDALGLPAAEHRLEGRSLIPLLHGEHSAWRRYAISEYDYAFQAPARERLGQPIDRCRMTMVRSERWKYLAYDGFRPQLFDLENDPQELHDLGADPAYARCAKAPGYLFEWLRGLKRRTTISHQEINVRGSGFAMVSRKRRRSCRSGCGDHWPLDGLTALPLRRRPALALERHPTHDAILGAVIINRVMLGGAVVPDRHITGLPAPAHGVFLTDHMPCNKPNRCAESAWE